MILYTWPEFFTNEHQVLNALMDKGVCWLHIYKPNASEEQVRQLIDAIEPTFRNRLVIHFYYSLAAEYGLGGIHFARNQYSDRFAGFPWISRSAHRWEDIETAEDSLTHLIISPVFESISKINHKSHWQLDQLADFFRKRKNKRIKYVALGGISPHNYVSVIHVGFDDAAFLGSFWKRFFMSFDMGVVAEFMAVVAQEEQKYKYKN